MRPSRSRWGRLRLRIATVALPLAVAAALFNPTPAFAAEMVADEGVLSAFSSGDVGRWKAAAERDAGNLKWRAVITVWCDNSSGAPVDCDLIEGTNVVTDLAKDPIDSGPTVVQHRDDWLDAANVHSKRFEHAWACEGTTLGKYQAFGGGLQVTSRFGEVGTAKDRDSGWTANFHGSC